MPKKIDWKYLRSFNNQDELDDFLDAGRPITIAKSNLNPCSICTSDLIEPHKMRSQYLNCNSKLCGPECEARYLVLNCDKAGKIDFYTVNEHLYKSDNAEQQVEDHMSRKCKKIIEFIILEKHITKPRFILRDLQQNEGEYELNSIPSINQITSFVRNKIQNLKNKGSIPLKYKDLSYVGSSNNLNMTNDNDSQEIQVESQYLEFNDDSETEVNHDEKSQALSDSLGKIDENIFKLKENQNRQSQFTDKYFEEIESRLKENKAKLIKEIEKSYHLFSERINYLKNKFKIENKIINDSSDLEEFRAKKEKLNSKMDHNNSDDLDNLEFMLNEANYINEQLESSLNQVEQNIVKIKRIRYEPNKSLFESGGLLGDLYEEEGNNNKKRKLDF
ncbi:unnamed protein product [Brachionus calyciflorus]|uniref:Uncharacterized protein n=1 Tax=Brachionus calyciflorus TaxID=104777 RepID=A0A814PH74_9BILA|nr:unnamed protein product [Brachionus calyciflorus]